MWVISAMLMFYGILFIVIEQFRKNKNIKPKIESFGEMTYLDAFKIGGYQILALIPGTSRSGSTIIGGLLTGVSRKIAVEFSFFMGIPIIHFIKIACIFFHGKSHHHHRHYDDESLVPTMLGSVM